MKSLHSLVLYNKFESPCAPLATSAYGPPGGVPQSVGALGGSSYLGVPDGKAIHVHR